MTSKTVSLIVCLLAVSGFTACRGQYFDWDDITPLDDYVHRPDDAYGYEFLFSEEEDDATVYVYNMTSQKWMDEDYIDRPIWWHILTVVIPDDLTKFDACIMEFLIGENDDESINENYGRMIEMAKETGAVVSRLQPLLNQPLYFADDPDVPRIEDAILARTWRHYIEAEEEPNPDMIAILPMIKAAKRAVDAVVEITNEIDPRIDIDKVMPFGLSKYGWTAWLLGCVDQRVFAIAPIVLDILNWHNNLHHHYEAYGGWSWAMSPYWSENITMYLDHPRAAEVGDDIAIDPLRYNPRMTMPKLISVASGDAFFLPDDSYYYFDELLPPKFMTMYENTGHIMNGQTQRYHRSLESFFETAYHEVSWPELTWSRSETDTDASIELQVDREPLAIRAFWADTTEAACGEGEDVCRRDFRERTAEGDTDVFWEEDAVEDLGDNTYRVTYDKRLDDGYRAFFIQMEFEGTGVNQTLDFTTEVQIIPDILPFPRCSSEEECRGTLL